MRTTIDLPTELLRQAKARAALDGVSLKSLITRFVQEGLRMLNHEEPPSPRYRRRRSDLPIIHLETDRRMPAYTNADLFEILEEEDVERAIGS